MCEACKGADAVRANILRTVTLILDNDQWPYNAIRALAEEMSAYDICEPGSEGHDDCDSDDPCCGMDSWPGYGEVGEAVLDWLSDYIDEHVDDELCKMILRDLLDLSDSMLAEMFGEHYYPDDARIKLDQAGREPG